MPCDYRFFICRDHLHFDVTLRRADKRRIAGVGVELDAEPGEAQTVARIAGACSPIQAVNTMPSRPPSELASAPISGIVRKTNRSMASCARASPPESKVRMSLAMPPDTPSNPECWRRLEPVDFGRQVTSVRWSAGCQCWSSRLPALVNCVGNAWAVRWQYAIRSWSLLY